jgi:hypothetical protein
MAKTRFEIHIFDATGRGKPVYEAYEAFDAARRKADRIVGGDSFTGHVQVWELEAAGGTRDLPVVAYSVHGMPDVKELRELSVWAHARGMTGGSFQQAKSAWQSGPRAESLRDFVADHAPATPPSAPAG